MLRCQGHPPYDWSVIEIDDPGDRTDEQMGTKDKFWFQSDGTYWLFKEVRFGDDDRARGEDWAECVVHVVAQLLGIPSACVSLASVDGARGVVVQTVLKEGEGLAHGNELLAEKVAGYDRSKRRQNESYTVGNIRLALAEYTAAAPHDKAFDQLAGYLVLDALVAGRDRHHENWAVIRGGERSGQLAPSFDHGNALGFAETPDKVERMCEDEGLLDRWLARGKSHQFAGKPSLVEVAKQAMGMASRQSADYFIDHLLHEVDSDKIVAALARFPQQILSEAHRRFAVLVIDRNRKRLLDAFGAC